MRTTLTIDDDLAGILKRKARELDKPFKEVVNTALRRGLAANLDNAPQRIAVRPHDFGKTRRIDSDSFNHLMDELEVEDDAHLAALAMDRALTLHSTDADFSRFPGLKWRNPLT